MSELPTVQVPAAQTLETNVKVPHHHRGGTYLRKHLGVGAHKGDRNAQRLLKSRECIPLRPLSCAKVDAMLKFRLCTRITVFFHLVLIHFLQMLSRSSESLLERRCSASSHSREQPLPRSPRLP